MGVLRGMEFVELTKLASGSHAEIMDIEGGKDMLHRLESLGVRKGIQVEKISRLRMGGPVILMVDRAQVAIGNGMASRIRVKAI